MIGNRKFICQFLLLLASTEPAVAQGRGLVPADSVDPARIRFVTTNAESSACIGRPRNPICGIETVIGCIEYARSRRCDRYRHPDVMTQARATRVEYALDKSGFVNPAKVRHVLRYGVVDEFLHYVYPSSFQARVLMRECPDELASCKGIDWTDLLFTINRRNGIWSSWITMYFHDFFYLVD